jgi:predicted DNA-binding protein with PD1-like motif
MLITHAFRLKPGQNLKKEIESFAKANNIKAGWIGCGVGSVTDYHIRFANQKKGNKGSGYFEIVSLAGTVSKNGCHIHISISDNEGKTIGGHLLDETIIYTTAEIIIQEEDELIFTREKDGTTSYNELKIERKNNDPGFENK